MLGWVVLRGWGDTRRVRPVQIRACRYDTTHGRFDGEVAAGDGSLVVNGTTEIKVFSEADPSKIPWGTAGAESVCCFK